MRRMAAISVGRRAHSARAIVATIPELPSATATDQASAAEGADGPIDERDRSFTEPPDLDDRRPDHPARSWLMR